MTDQLITLVLDASAVIAFTRSSIHVGEVLTQVGEEDAVAAIPLPCLVEAASTVADNDRLEVLVTHPTTVLLAEDPWSWRALIATYELVGRYDAAAAALTALDNNAAVLTRRPVLYANLDEGGLVIPIDE